MVRKLTLEKPAPRIALLRAINVGGTGKVSMERLRELMTQLGFSEVRSLLQTGNLVFHGGGKSAGKTSAALEQRLELACEEELGLRTEFFVRTVEEWAALVAGNPFPAEAKSDPGRLIAIPLKGAPGAPEVEALRAAIVGRERVSALGRTLYATYPDGSGNSKLTLGLIERKLGTRGTGRNWNTVLKLAKLASGAD